MSYDPTVSWCQNLIRGERADWSDSQYCGAPALDLGERIRNICQTCHDGAERFRDDLLAAWSKAIVANGGAAEWLARQEAIVADLHQWLDREAAQGAPMSELHKIRRDLAGRERCTESVLAAQRAANTQPQPAFETEQIAA
jgi:hypothetical protein